jgi:hypothetical protein
VRDLSASAVAAGNAESTDKVWVVLLEISATGLPIPIRVCNDNVNVVHKGASYISFPFEIEMPPESADRPMVARLKIDNTDRTIVEQIRALADTPSITVTVVLADQPDTIELQYAGMKLRNATWDAGEVTGDLTYEDILNEPVCEQITPARFPGAF